MIDLVLLPLGIALVLIWRTRGERWRRVWWIYLHVWCAKVLLWTVAGSEGLRDMVHLYIDPVLLVAMAAAVIEAYWLRISLLDGEVQGALTVTLTCLSAFAVIAVWGWWEPMDATGVYNQIRLSAQLGMVLFLGFSVLWPARCPRAITTHATILTAHVANYVWGSFLPSRPFGDMVFWEHTRTLYLSISVAVFLGWLLAHRFQRCEP